MVKTPPFHGGNMGSNPVRVTKLKASILLSKSVLFSFCRIVLLETSRSTISFWENGEREPTMSSLIKLSKFFKVSIDYLVGLEK